MKKLTVALLLLAMLASAFAACGSPESGNTVTTGSATTALPETDPVTSEDYTLELPEGLNFEGETFTFVITEENVDWQWRAAVVIAE